MAGKKERPEAVTTRKAPSKTASAKKNGDDRKSPAIVSKSQTFHMVGIGASAGGLEAFEAVFRNMPDNPDMAFVLVPHLDPDHASLLPQLVQRFTGMKVSQVEDGSKALPNNVHIVPPNRDLSIFNGTFQLMEPVGSRAVRLPIDHFFRSLAQDQKEKAICIVLSGMGTDGALGLRAIKENSGMVIAQAPETAKFDSMPRSAVETGLVDCVLPPERIGEHLAEYRKHSTHRASGPREVHKDGEMFDAVQKIYILLREQTGHDFSLYKPNTIWRRIERRMDVHRLDHASGYVRYLQENPREVETLFKELLIGVTRFFRDPESFQILKEKIFLEYLRAKPDNDPVRVWVPGCSTGEEAYSVAVIINECMETLGRRYNAQIFATDIDEDAIAIARQGAYPESISGDVNADRLKRFFSKEDNIYRVNKSVREMLVFALHDILKDPPFTKMDLICCRNLLIYLDSMVQKKLLPLFHYSLKPEGILFLGSSETIGGAVDLFSVSDRKWKIFTRRISTSAGRTTLEFPPMPPAGNAPVIRRWTGCEPDIRRLAEGFLIQSYAPPSVLINEKGDIQYIHGRTGKYLEPAPGEANFNILYMAREGLRGELSRAIRRAGAEKRDIVSKGLRVRSNGHLQSVDVYVKPVMERGAQAGLLMVIFEDAGSVEETKRPVTDGRSKKKPKKRLEVIEQELQVTRENLQSTVEELETVNEALSAANEELQSTNEELQSANEELETTKEEQQSLNEELVTVNTELQSKLDEFSTINNDMRNLLDSTEIPTIFLDDALNVKRFTPQATRVVPLIQSDIGRPIGHIVSNLKYGDLAENAKEVLGKPGLKELEVEDKNGHWYLMRLLPYRTIDNVIEGVVVSFFDIHDRKEAADKIESLNLSLQESRDYAEAIIATLREPLLVLDQDLRVISANSSFYKTFQVERDGTEGKFIYDLGNGQWDIPGLRELLERIIPKNDVFEDYAVEHTFPTIGSKKMLLNARRIAPRKSARALILLAIENLTGKMP